MHLWKQKLGNRQRKRREGFFWGGERYGEEESLWGKDEEDLEGKSADTQGERGEGRKLPGSNDVTCWGKGGTPERRKKKKKKKKD